MATFDSSLGILNMSIAPCLLSAVGARFCHTLAESVLDAIGDAAGVDREAASRQHRERLLG